MYNTCSDNDYRQIVKVKDRNGVTSRKTILLSANLTHTLVQSDLKPRQAGQLNENRHLVFLIFKKEQENDGVGDISSLFQRLNSDIPSLFQRHLTMSLE